MSNYKKFIILIYLMIICIPIGGIGQRFKNNNYNKPHSYN